MWDKPFACFANHSRAPNTTIIRKNGKNVVVSLRTIEEGEEITLDYRNKLNPYREFYSFRV